MKKKRISEHLHGIFAKSIIKLQGVEEAKNTLGSPCSSNCTIITRCILVIIIYSYYYTQSSLTLVRVKTHMKFSTEKFEIWRLICSFRISTYVCPMCDIFFVSLFHFFINNSSVSLTNGMQHIWIEETWEIWHIIWGMKNIGGGTAAPSKSAVGPIWLGRRLE